MNNILGIILITGVIIQIEILIRANCHKSQHVIRTHSGGCKLNQIDILARINNLEIVFEQCRICTGSLHKKTVGIFKCSFAIVARVV